MNTAGIMTDGFVRVIEIVRLIVTGPVEAISDHPYEYESAAPEV